MWLCEDFIGVHAKDQFCRTNLGEDVLGLRDCGVVWDVPREAMQLCALFDKECGAQSPEEAGEFLCRPSCFLCATPTPLHSLACLLATVLQWSLSLCRRPGRRISSCRNTTATFSSCLSPCRLSRVSSAFSAVSAPPPTFQESMLNSRLLLFPVFFTASRCFGG